MSHQIYTKLRIGSWDGWESGCAGLSAVMMLLAETNLIHDPSGCAVEFGATMFGSHYG